MADESAGAFKPYDAAGGATTSGEAAPFKPYTAPAAAPAAPAAPQAHGMGVGETLERGLGWDAVADTVGLGRSGARRPDQVVLNPQGGLEHAASLAVTIPASVATGAGLGAVAARLGAPALAGVAGAVGRAGFEGGKGAAAGAQRGEDALSAGLLDGVSALLWGEAAPRALISGVPRVFRGGLTARGAPARAFDEVAGQVRQAYDMIRSRLGNARVVNVPVLSRTPLTPDEAVTQLAQRSGPEFDVARQQILAEFDRIDAGKFIPRPGPPQPHLPVHQQFVPTPPPHAAQIFEQQTPATRVPPSTGARVADTARRGLEAPAVRATLGGAAAERVGGGQDNKGAVPAGVIGGGAVASALNVIPRSLGSLAHAIYGGFHP